MGRSIARFQRQQSDLRGQKATTQPSEATGARAALLVALVVLHILMLRLGRESNKYPNASKMTYGHGTRGQFTRFNGME